MWRAYTLKEAFRAIFAGDLTPEAVEELIDQWISQASRSRLPAFVKTAKTIRKHRDGLLAAIRLNINNGRAEGLNNVVRLIFRRARGFGTAPRQPSPWSCSPADPSPCNYHTNDPTITDNDPHSCREGPLSGRV